MLDDPKRMALAGYAALMNVDVTLFSIPGVHVVETIIRDNPEWSNWIIPIWFVKFETSTVCSVSPTYRNVVDEIITRLNRYSLLSPNLGSEVTALTIGGEWTQREILIYPSAKAPEVKHKIQAVRLTEGHGPYASYFL